MKVFISTSSFGVLDTAPLDRLASAGIVVSLNPHGRALTEDEILGFLAGIDGLVAGTEPLTAKVFAERPGLKVVSRVGTGLDSVDLGAAEARGVRVYNTPEAPASAVAEFTVGVLLALLRRIALSDRRMHAGEWRKEMGASLCGRRVLVVGYGRIGRRVAGALSYLGAEVTAYDPHLAEDPDYDACSAADLDEALSSADVLALHLSYSPACHHLIDARRMDLMPPGAVIVNTSRGGLVDEDALGERLADGRLGGAALDVFEREPYAGPLAEFDNVVLTPHIGGYAAECRVAMEREAVENLLEGLGLS